MAEEVQPRMNNPLRDVNIRTAAKILVEIRKWFKGRAPAEVSVEEVRLRAAIYVPNKKWTDEELDVAWRMYQMERK